MASLADPRLEMKSWAPVVCLLVLVTGDLCLFCGENCYFYAVFSYIARRLIDTVNVVLITKILVFKKYSLASIRTCKICVSFVQG